MDLNQEVADAADPNTDCARLVELSGCHSIDMVWLEALANPSFPLSVLLAYETHPDSRFRDVLAHRADLPRDAAWRLAEDEEGIVRDGLASSTFHTAVLLRVAQDKFSCIRGMARLRLAKHVLPSAHERIEALAELRSLHPKRVAKAKKLLASLFS